jgi:hypothetical protein
VVGRYIGWRFEANSAATLNRLALCICAKREKINLGTLSAYSIATSSTIQSYLFNMTRMGSEKTVVLSCRVFNNITKSGWCCHDNEVLHEYTHLILWPRMSNKCSFKCLYKYVNFSHEVRALALHLEITEVQFGCYPLLSHLCRNNPKLCKTTIKWGVISLAFQQYANENDRCRRDLTMCKSRSMSWNQLQKLDQPSNIHNSVDTIEKWAKLPPNEVKFQ